MTMVSLITTVLNEEASIICLLDSLQKQTFVPAEIIIVDAGSTDQTVPLIKSFRKENSLKIRLFIKPLNRSQARNFAISKARHEIIAVTDAGCLADKHWLEQISEPIVKNKAESVAGFYLTLTPTYLSKAIAPFVAVLPEKLDLQTYLPSSRSVAFTKDAWHKAGKYPEHLNYCEDLIFARELKDKTVMKVAPQALVYWTQKTSYSEFFSQMKHYAKGDVEAGYAPHIKKLITVFLRYGIFVIFPPLFLLYLFYPVYKHRKISSDPLVLSQLPAVQITADIGVMMGTLLGLWRLFGVSSQSRRQPPRLS